LGAKGIKERQRNPKGSAASLLFLWEGGRLIRKERRGGRGKKKGRINESKIVTAVETEGKKKEGEADWDRMRSPGTELGGGRDGQNKRENKGSEEIPPRRSMQYI